MQIARPFFIIAAFTGAFAGMTIAAYEVAGIAGALPGIVGLVIQIPFILYVRRKLAHA